MDMLKSYIDNALAAIDGTTSLFYQNKINEGYMTLNDTIGVLSNTVDEIFKHQSALPEFDEEKLVGILSEALKALEGKDILLFSDILQYEFKEILEQIKASLL